MVGGLVYRVWGIAEMLLSLKRNGTYKLTDMVSVIMTEGCPHTSFRQAQSGGGGELLKVGSCSKPPTPSRESIEVRAMVFSKVGG